ncbi:MotA/TolQ/ExbB proton channel family protein [candidate division KSB1 bacterium]|nr:MotA/TolQ/ExbB proton channel family protein [candidate division KSB1 bacterium]
MSLWELFIEGGWLIVALMLPILICSVVALAIFIERVMVLRKMNVNTRSFIMQIQAMLRKGRISDAVLYCKRTPGPVAKIAKAGLERYKRPRNEVKEAIESSGKAEIYHLERRLGILGTIAAIAPLFGFLGTVIGMMQAFSEIVARRGIVGPDVLAGGIWEALSTTAFGLMVGIMAIIFHNWIQGKIESHVFDMQQSSVDLLDLLIDREASANGFSDES